MNDTMNRQNETLTLFSVPMLPPERKAAAAVQSIALVQTPGEQNVMRIVIKRDLSVRIRSFTFRYRFSNLPVYAADPRHNFNTYLYDEDDINDSAQITFNGAVPGRQIIEGCSAYISAIQLESGQILTFEPSDFKFVLRPKKKTAPPSDTAELRQVVERRAPVQPEALSLPASVPAPADVPPRDEKPRSSSGKRIRLTVILTLFIFTLLTEVLGGVYLYRYMSVKNSADMLMSDGRFHEAYKLVSDADYPGILQRVCEKASVYYFSTGDLESAYIYAMGAPEPFPQTAIDYATQSVVSMATGDINRSAYRVAKMTDDDAEFDGIINAMSDVLQKRGDYANALRVISEFRSEETRRVMTESVFKAALDYYIASHRYDAVIAFIDEMTEDTTFEKSAEIIVEAAIDCCLALDDHAGLLLLADHYADLTDMSAAQAVISPDDYGIRSKFSELYPKLTAEQKRAYHAQPVAVWQEDITLIESGRITGTDVRDAVSIDRSGALTLILRKNGRAELLTEEGKDPAFEIPNYADVVQIALGEGHAVLLHSNGTVSAYGDNDRGQCDVSDWTDIAAVAAGQSFTVGLKIDGTLVAAGANDCGQCDVTGYRNAVDVAACNQTTVILFADGTAAVQGYRSFGLHNVEALTGIRRIRAGGAAILTETEDGRCELFTGHSGGNYGDPYNWRGMTCFDVGFVCIAGIDKNGALYYDGDGLTVD